MIGDALIKADFHSLEFSDWKGNILVTCENVALNLKKTSRVTKTLLCKNSVCSENSTEWKSALLRQ